jgi:hypothetical protein
MDRKFHPHAYPSPHMPFPFPQPHNHPHTHPYPHPNSHPHPNHQEGRVVALRSLANNKYVTVHHDHKLVASKDHVHDSEKFELVRLNGNRIGLRSLHTHRFVCAENAGAGSLIANREQASIWEEFELIQLADGKVGLRACINGRFVCAEGGGQYPLIANRDGAGGAWEEFYMIDLVSKHKSSRIVSLRSQANNQFIGIVHHGHLMAHSHHVHQTERFEIIPLNDTKVALRSVANFKFICAEEAGSKPLSATRDAASIWEEFEIHVINDHHVAIKACINGRYVCAEGGGKQPLIANRDAAKGVWEAFVLSDA